MKPNILIIEDDRRIADWLKRYFEKAGYSAETEYDGKSGLDAALNSMPDLVILDLNLPKLDGIDVCKTLRAKSSVPVIMLTARESHADRIKGLSIGADDYVVKPFDPDEVIARATAVLRRVKDEVKHELRAGRLLLDSAAGTVSVGDSRLELSRIQFNILEVFMRSPGRVFTREQLAEAAYENEFDSFDRAIDNQILRLRKKLTGFGLKPIKTVYGGGYRFDLTEE